MKLPWQKAKSKTDSLVEMWERGDWVEEESRTRGGQLIRVVIRENLLWLTAEIDNCSAFTEPERMTQLQSDKRAMMTISYALNRWDAEGKKARTMLGGRVSDWSGTSFDAALPNQGAMNVDDTTSN